MKKKTKQQNQQKRSDVVRRELNDIKKFLVQGASNEDVEDQIKRFLKKWKKSSQATAIAEIKNFLLQQIEIDNIHDEIMEFIASWKVSAKPSSVRDDRFREYARLQRKKADASKRMSDIYGSVDSKSSLLAEAFKEVFRAGKTAGRIDKSRFPAMKLAEDYPDKFNELFEERSDGLELMVESMLYINPNQIFRLISIMEGYIRITAEYFPSCASYFLKSAISNTNEFISMSKKGCAFDPDASANTFLPWPKTYWTGEYPGFKDVAKHLNLAGKQINKARQSRINSAATRCTVACIVATEDIRNSDENTKEKEFAKEPPEIQKYLLDPVIKEIKDDLKEIELECKKLPDLSDATIDDWWKVMEPMVEKKFGNQDYGDAKFWENVAKKYPDDQMHTWKDRCKQALESLVHKNAVSSVANSSKKKM